MGMDMRGALVKAGLATEKQIQDTRRAEEDRLKAEAEAKERAKRDRFAELAPKSRFGKVPVYAQWVKTGMVPTNTANFCCVCGRTGTTVAKAAKAAAKEQTERCLPEAHKALSENAPGAVQYIFQMLADTIAGVRAHEDLLYRTDLGDSLPWLHGKELSICSECLEHLHTAQS